VRDSHSDGRESRKSGRRFVALLIGQSPRPDLTDPLRRVLPGVDVIEVGVLDDIDERPLPADDSEGYPLTTRLRSGDLLTVREDAIGARLVGVLARSEVLPGVVASGLLCAGAFGSIRGVKPFVKPFDLTCALLRELTTERIGVVVPYEEQQTVAAQKWRQVGFEARVWKSAEDPEEESRRLEFNTRSMDLNCVVLDYVGYSSHFVSTLKERCPVPVVDVGRVAIAAIGAIMNEELVKPSGGGGTKPLHGRPVHDG
jgi:protein AroM